MGKARMSLSRLAAIWWLCKGGVSNCESLSRATGLSIDDVKGATDEQCEEARYGKKNKSGLSTAYESITLAKPVRCESCPDHPLLTILPCLACKLAMREQRYSMNRWEQTQEPVTLGKVGLTVYPSRPWSR